MIGVANGRKIGRRTERHVAPRDVHVPKMDNADGRMLETGLIRGKFRAGLPILWQSPAISAEGRSLDQPGRPWGDAPWPPRAGTKGTEI